MTLAGNQLGIHSTSIYNSSIEIEDKPLDLGLGNTPLTTNAIGYRKRENAIYGIKYQNNQQILFRKSIDGELTDLHAFSDDEINSPLAGCMSSDDDHLLIFTTGEHALVSIGLKDSSYTYTSVLVEGLENYGLLDIAVNPMNGLVYGIATKGRDPTTFKVATIDPSTGQLLELSEFIDPRPLGTFPSIAITSNEILIAYNYNSIAEDILAYYHIPSKTIVNVIEETLPIFEDLGDYGMDGCSCLSGTIKVQKYFSQDTITSCRNERLTYRILNYDIDNTNKGFLITDTFPEELNIEEVLFSNSVYDINIESDSIINISSPNGLKYGLDSIVFVVSVQDSTTKSFESQAVLYNCWDVTNDCTQVITRSDDPKYPNEENDPTGLTISSGFEASPPEVDSVFYKCPDSIITLSLFPGTVGFEIEWNDGSRDNSRSFDDAGTYPVIIRDNCNEYELEVNIVEPRVKVELEPDYEVVYGTTVEIFSSIESDLPLQTQTWYLDTQLIELCEGECSSVSLSALDDQVITTQIIDEAACVDEASSMLKVEVPIFAPTAFSPNQDGINDIYYLQSKADILVQNLEIYDRWGGRVFHKEDFNTNDETSGWDGTVRGKDCETGTYVWFAVIDIKGERLKLNGEINLIR
jgi:gliding motility-associated-like protein